MEFLWIVCSILLLHKPTLAQTLLYEVSEGCPKDSILIDGVCKCDHTLCDKPPCIYELKLVAEFSDTPGSCCPKYSCEGCKKTERLEDQCPCAPEAVLKFGQKCKCVDHHKKLINNTCVCDPGKCELPDLCDERSVAVKEMDGCCEKIKCIPCPDDSFVTLYNEFVVEDKCVCFPCPVTRCNETQTPQILRRGKNVPGMCCDIYNCVSVDPNLGCLVNETLYSVGETWSFSENICVCQQHGITYCSPSNPTSESHGFRPCLENSKVFNHLDTWLMEDACTNCTCIDGIVKCIAHMCDIHTSEMKKSDTFCPHFFTCHKHCENGFKVNAQGCNICQCNDEEVSTINCYQITKLLNQYNLTKDQVMDLIKTLGQGGSFTDVTNGVVTSIPTTRTSSTSSSTSTSSKSTVVPLTNICRDSNNTLGDCAFSCLLEYGLPGFVIGTILGTILVLMFRKCFEKNRQKYTMYMPVGKDTTVDKNLNFSTIIKQNTKNFELQSYNEKKNAI